MLFNFQFLRSLTLTLKFFQVVHLKKFLIDLISSEIHTFNYEHSGWIGAKQLCCSI